MDKEDRLKYYEVIDQIAAACVWHEFNAVADEIELEYGLRPQRIYYPGRNGDKSKAVIEPMPERLEYHLEKTCTEKTNRVWEFLFLRISAYQELTDYFEWWSYSLPPEVPALALPLCPSDISP